MSIINRFMNDIPKCSGVSITHNKICFVTKPSLKSYFIGNYGNVKVLNEEQNLVCMEILL